MNKIFITCKESKIENNHSFYGSFYIGPFNEAQSLTVANALRRSLLSDCVGLGMTSVIIENVSHEYSTLPGIRESILDILLNLKEIVFKKKQNLWQIYKKKGFFSIYEEVGSLFLNPFVGYLKIRGPGIVRAKDLCLPPFIQCVDPNQYIATLAHDGFLNMKFVITEGKGYKVQKSNKDLNFSLVKKRQELLNDLIEIQPIMDERSMEREINSSPLAPMALSAQAWGTHTCNDGRQPSKTAENLNKKKILSVFSSKTAIFNKKHPFFGENLNKKERVGGSTFKSSTQLFLDTVFNPITKVNYVIEAIESKSVTNDHQKSSLVDDLTSFLETSNIYQTNFPLKKSSKTTKRKTLKHINVTSSASPLCACAESLGACVTFISLAPRDSAQDTRVNVPKVPLTESNTRAFGARDEGLRPAPKSTHVGVGNLAPRDTVLMPKKCAGTEKKKSKASPHTQHSLQAQKQHKKIIEIMNKYLDFELNLFSTSLHPLKNNDSLHNIILEIWTNGSLHPRDALSLAFQNLSFLFLNMQKTKIYNPFFSQASSYNEFKKKLLTN